MLELLKRNSWWPGIKNDIKKYVQGYIKYQQNKVQHIKKAGKLNLLKLLEEPQQKTSIDIIGLLPKSKGFNVIVVIVDRFMKIIQLKVTTTMVLSEEITRIYRDKIWKLHKVLQKALSDRRPQFASKFIKDLMKALEIKKNYLQYIILKLIVKWNKSTRRLKLSCDTI